MILRGTLFRKYVVYFVTLVTVALIASGGIGVYFTYKESKAALLDLQREKAAAAASRIEAYVSQIEHQIGWMRLPQVGASNPEQRRFDYLKLLRQVPAITDIIQVDRSGQVKLRVSRLGMDVAGGGEDLSKDPEFTVPKSGKTYFSPVYFRKETEPYMTIAWPGISDEAGITIAEVNLEVHLGRGFAHQNRRQGPGLRGRLARAPDRPSGYQPGAAEIGSGSAAAGKAALTAQDTDDATCQHRAQSAGRRGACRRMRASSRSSWHVFVEQSIAEAFAPLVCVASCAPASCCSPASCCRWRRACSSRAAWSSRSAAVTEGAPRIGAGELDQDIEVHTGDELEALADQFNSHGRAAADSYAGLERKVEERTARADQDARVADCDHRDSARDFQLADRRAAGVRLIANARAALSRRTFGRSSLVDGECVSVPDATRHGRPNTVQAVRRPSARSGPRTTRVVSRTIRARRGSRSARRDLPTRPRPESSGPE